MLGSGERMATMAHAIEGQPGARLPGSRRLANRARATREESTSRRHRSRCRSLRQAVTNTWEEMPDESIAAVYMQVLIGIAAGLLLGLVSPKLAVDMKPLADGFVKLIKMCVGPIVFLAIVHGINSAGNLKTAGRGS